GEKGDFGEDMSEPVTATRSFLVPKMSWRYLLYRLPFYVNMICLGYSSYWEARLGFYTDQDPVWRFGGDASFIHIANILWAISWCVAAVFALCTLGKGRKTDRFGLYYLVFALLVTLVACLALIRVPHPSS
ncbi:MAG TPA: hypothetical protein VM492_12640, partial [Sumerlaeia bacterium]|nr:hypothetical protein [Sumerlaeia bacterium]